MIGIKSRPHPRDPRRLSRYCSPAVPREASDLRVDAEPAIFRDTLAGGQTEEPLAYHHLHRTHPSPRPGSRLTEDRIIRGNSGIDQYPIPAPTSIRSLSGRVPTIPAAEADQPVTRPSNGNCSTTPCPPRSPRPGRRRTGPAVQSGLGPSRPVFASWLGVTADRTRKAILATLTDLGGFAPGPEIVTDHRHPAELRHATGNGPADAAAPMATEQAGLSSPPRPRPTPAPRRVRSRRRDRAARSRSGETVPARRFPRGPARILRPPTIRPGS